MIRMHHPLFLDAAQIRSRIKWPQLMQVLERALIAFSAGRAAQPLRTIIDFPAGCLFSMPAYLDDPRALGAKLVTICPGNTAIETHQATLIMLDPDTGELKALLDGAAITQLRTAAVSALSVRELARPDSKVLAIIGAGVQARGHVEALRALRTFQQVRAWSPTPTRLAAFTAEANIEATPSAAAAVCDADVIVLATSSSQPVIAKEWVKPGAHIVSVGAPRPSQREIDPALIESSQLYVDSRISALAESGDVTSQSPIIGELGELLARQIPGRQTATEITIFKSLGLAVEDIATAALLI
jgi:alanine dehydrogenase